MPHLSPAPLHGWASHQYLKYQEPWSSAQEFRGPLDLEIFLLHVPSGPELHQEPQKSAPLASKFHVFRSQYLTRNSHPESAPQPLLCEPGTCLQILWVGTHASSHLAAPTGPEQVDAEFLLTLFMAIPYPYWPNPQLYTTMSSSALPGKLDSRCKIQSALGSHSGCYTEQHAELLPHSSSSKAMV